MAERCYNTNLRSEDISRVLPEAVHLTLKENPTLNQAVIPTVEEAIKTSVTMDQNTLSEALFPIMGPAIRKAIAAAIQNLTDSLNQSLEHSLSLRSLSWRFEAWRTGKSFAEVLLLRTLIYQVEQVFLIHKSTGLVLEHLVSAATVAQDPDLVAAMFTAIQDFVRDSFSASDDTLGSLQVGELTIWVNEGPQALIACVIRGNAPANLRLTMANALERIHVIQDQELRHFQGDSSLFAPSQPYLQDCLQSQYQAKEPSKKPLIWVGSALGLLLLGWGVWSGFAIHEQHQVQALVDRLNQEPGIVVLQTQKQGGEYVISGLRDPLAKQPLDLIQQSDLDPQQVKTLWEPYLSFDPQLILTRVTAVLKPPPTVKLRTDEQGTLLASGIAPQSWINDAQRLALQLPNVTRFDTQQLQPTEKQELMALQQKIEAQSFVFTEDIQLAANQEQRLSGLVQDLRSLTQLAKTLKQPVTVLVEGRTDFVGQDIVNLSVQQARANTVTEKLVAQGIDKTLLKPVATQTQSLSPQDRSKPKVKLDRKVTFKLVFTQPTAPQ